MSEFEKNMHEFELLKRNETKAKSDVKLIKAKCDPLEEVIVKYMASQSKAKMLHTHKDAKTGRTTYYQYTLPKPRAVEKKVMPKKEEYVVWLKDNWSNLMAEIKGGAGHDRVYDLFIDQAMKRPKASSETSKNKPHIILKELTEQEWTRKFEAKKLEKARSSIRTESDDESDGDSTEQ